MEGLIGLMERDTGTGVVTVRAVEPVTKPSVAEIVVPPARKAVTDPTVVMPATYGTDELQTTDLVRSCVEVSLYVPMAVNCTILPCAAEKLTGVTAMLMSAACPTLAVAEDETPPKVALIV